MAFRIFCGDVAFSDFREAWSYEGDEALDLCEAEQSGGASYTDEQTEAAGVAGYLLLEDVATLVALCAETRGHYAQRGQPLSNVQIVEARGMLSLCPDFPRADIVQANIKQSLKEQRERADGTRFEDGSYRVGKKIKPGTYFVPRTVAKGCYWERLDRRGDIIANNIVMARTRVQVTIRASDYTFSSDRCGEWRRAD
ncbi:MAG: hypothetical protein IPL43_02360 [Micropruina sp.]|nr:hypothetical protein [Micropruina sp.]